jgi:hypothetical protein
MTQELGFDLQQWKQFFFPSPHGVQSISAARAIFYPMRNRKSFPSGEEARV